MASNRNVTLNDDGSADLRFAPERRASGETNWIKTVPGHGWFAALRLYGQPKHSSIAPGHPAEITEA
jgi:hypothetical protein